MSSALTENLNISEVADTSRTYLDTGETISNTKIDELEAMKAAIVKRLATEQYEYPIYSFEYGIRSYDLLGKDKVYVVSELKRRIIEALLRDERIKEVSDFTYTHSEDSLFVNFTVTTIFGVVETLKEVKNV